MNTAEKTGYSLENAVRFNWSSVSGNLNAERVLHLSKYLVGKSILDAGCGGGGYVDFLCRQGYQVTGIDKFAEFLGVADERGYQGTFIQGDVTGLPFPDNAFDTVFCFDVLEHVDDEAAIRELARVARSRVIVAVPKEGELLREYGLTFAHYTDMTHLRYYSEATLARLAETVNPRSVQVIPELSVDLAGLARNFIAEQHRPFPKPVIGLDSGKSLLRKWLLPRLVQIMAVRSVFKVLYESNESYMPVYSGLVAVIDVDK